MKTIVTIVTKAIIIMTLITQVELGSLLPKMRD